jgi:hypothetical protein
MTRLLFTSAFLLGTAAIIWMASYFIGSNTLALMVTLVIGCVYTIGFAELLQFRRATATLSAALATVPDTSTDKAPALDSWLARLHPSLQNSVRLRIEGERVGLPAPAITPYLVGLLVMLGLLGTFVGMVVTLQGAVLALEGTTELAAIRAGLAAPINGLSLAFGTSVAGVAASAMLGLTSTLSRRDRMLATRQLDSRIADVFRGYSLLHNRQETYKALQMQAQALPAVAEKLQTMAEQLERMGDNLGDKLLSNQAAFHQTVERTYTDLSGSVGKSLRDSLADSGRLAGESIKPLVEEVMAGISKEARTTHQHLSTTAQEQLATLGAQFADTSSSLLQSFDQASSTWLEQQQTGDSNRLAQWTESLHSAQQQATLQLRDTAKTFADEVRQVTQIQQDTFAASTSKFDALSAALAERAVQSTQQMEQLGTTMGSQLSALRSEEDRRGQAAIERLAELESTVASHLASLGKALEEPMTRLIQTASETPRAAAEVIGHLRQEISNNIERDNSLLEERTRLMAQLDKLCDSLGQASSGQREAIESLVHSSTELLQQVAQRFTDHVATELSTVSATSENLAGSAVEMSSLGEAFGLAVTLFNESNNNLIEHLERIEQSMDKSSERSDEQMGYYVAQAREIIDQSMMSQKEVFDELRQIGRNEELFPAEAS